MQRTYVRHERNDTFAPGRVPGLLYRDLGMAEITGGKFAARVIRADGPAQDTDWHRHEDVFSITYVLKGWLEVEYEDIGRQHLEAGSVTRSWHGPRHRELACGDGFEALILSTPGIPDSGARRVAVQHERDAAFEAGLRDYFIYRDFGVRQETDGALGAHMVRVMPDKQPHGQWHTHALGFQFVYVPQGWVEFEYEDIGRVRLEAGSMVYQPPMIRHAEIAHSDDVEIFEAVAPAEFETRKVEAPAPALATAK